MRLLRPRAAVVALGCGACAVTRHRVLPASEGTENPLDRRSMVEAHTRDMVHAILRHQTLNIAYLPDTIEREVYSFAIGVTYKYLLKWTSYLHGVSFLKHQMILELKEDFDADAVVALMAAETIDVARLEQVVDLMLSNKELNIWVIPDALERRVYLAALAIIFQALQAFARSTSVGISGHELSLNFKANSNWKPEDVVEKMLTGNSAVIDELVDDHLSAHNILWIPDAVERALLRNLYALVPALIDSVLGKADLRLLGNSIKIHLEPLELGGGGAGSAAAAATELEPGAVGLVAREGGIRRRLSTSEAVMVGWVGGVVTGLLLGLLRWR